jgi:hypothetical protein
MQLNEVHEKWLIILVALHSLIIGAAFFSGPHLLVRFGGWERIEPVFFAYQAGAFHVALASAYLIEYFKYRGITVLLAAKSIAFVFLLVTPIFVAVPWAVPFSGVADGAMALLVWWVHRKVGAPSAS